MSILTHQPHPRHAPAEPHHQPELDGIRGIAILAVMLSHAAGLMGVRPYHRPHTIWASLAGHLLIPGWGGVDLFFTLSGFLITGILLRARTRTTYFSAFYARRILRIFPIYYLFLSLTLLAAHLWPSFGLLLPQTGKQRLSYFLYLQNWPCFWMGWTGMTSLWGVFWSLAVEEQFYLVWPTVIRFLRTNVILICCLLGVTLGTPLRYWILFHMTGMNVGVLQFPTTRLDGLFLGAALALYRESKGRPVPLAWAWGFFWAGALLFLQIFVFHFPELFSIGTHIATYGVTAFALMSGGLIAASQHPVSWLRRILTFSGLRLAGRYSYGMYVYHLLVYAAFTWLAKQLSPSTGGELILPLALLWMAAAIATTTGLAILSYRYFEEPLLRLKRFFPSPAAPVGVSPTPPETQA